MKRLMFEDDLGHACFEYQQNPSALSVDINNVSFYITDIASFRNLFNVELSDFKDVIDDCNITSNGVPLSITKTNISFQQLLRFSVNQEDYFEITQSRYNQLKEYLKENIPQITFVDWTDHISFTYLNNNITIKIWRDRYNDSIVIENVGIKEIQDSIIGDPFQRPYYPLNPIINRNHKGLFVDITCPYDEFWYNFEITDYELDKKVTFSISENNIYDLKCWLKGLPKVLANYPIEFEN